MMNFQNTVKILTLVSLCSIGQPLYANENNERPEQTNEQGIIEIKADNKDLFEIKIEKLTLKDIAKEITSPGEVVLNTYKTAIVALRIDGQITKRLAKMGEKVTIGQPMAIISSIRMSDAQQAYIVDVKEWRRVKQLGREVVSGKRYISARSKWKSSKARLLAFGLDQVQLTRLEKEQKPDGIFKVNSPIDGIVIKDDFIEGQYASAGTSLFEVSDESIIWVEASVSPDQAALFSPGDLATIFHSGESHQGKITQISHLVSESTRTQKIRIEIENSKDDLHPGQFVTAKLQQAQTQKKIAVPESALVRTTDGDWGVFVEVSNGQYKQHEVEVIARQGNLMIISGLKIGTPVVIDGAFYLSAELAKAGFDPHNH